MAFYSFLTDRLFPKKQITRGLHREDGQRKLSLKEMMEELGVRTTSTIGTYNEEEHPDNLSIETYLQMQENDGTVRAIARLFAMPIQATSIKVNPGKNDKGEREFIENVFCGPPFLGGMSTPLPFVIADMTRAITEGFRLYEKVPQIIKTGPYTGKIGWRKLAPRDSKTLRLSSDSHGGFAGAHQIAYFGNRTVDVQLPAEKCILFTFQKERHPLYGESILKTAFYHYDKKHKLYYLAHKKAEIDAIGLKILKILKPTSDTEVSAAEKAIDEIGVNTRVSLPSGFELDVNRAPSGYDVLKLIEHHDTQIALSTLTQAMRMGTSGKYAYTYGRGYETQGAFIVQMLDSVMRSMENTLNEWAIAPLIDWNFGSQSYPTIKLMPAKAEIQEFLIRIFETLLKKDPDSVMTSSFANKLADEVAEMLGLETKSKENTDAYRAFESGKKKEFDRLSVPAIPTPKEIKEEIKKKAILLKDDIYFFEKFEVMGRNFAQKQIKMIKK